ncbi:DUF6310 domain-containing protein [Stigmatella hybrida]|uniref:DUF6310 domain-containing protein n=1 Tax=Stigmatella hybrida TaxID=394097 RepID=UPI00295EFDFD|nr:DUF6310 domain-containing protein [Stigmatella hybrida]
MIVAGVVVVAAVIEEELDAYERRASRERAKAATQTRPVKELSVSRKPKPEGSDSGDIFPPLPPATVERVRRPECKPIPGPSRGGNEPHNECADRIAGNNFPGLNVFVNGKHFDALVLATRTLWEVKTDNFDIHSPRSQAFFAKVKLPEIRREAMLANACGYNFVVGVKSAAHKAALESLDRTLAIVVMDWC